MLAIIITALTCSIPTLPKDVRISRAFACPAIASEALRAGRPFDKLWTGAMLLACLSRVSRRPFPKRSPSLACSLFLRQAQDRLLPLRLTSRSKPVRFPPCLKKDPDLGVFFCGQGGNRTHTDCSTRV